MLRCCTIMGKLLFCLLLKFLRWTNLQRPNSVPTDVSVFKGVPHGYRRFGDRLTASKAWDKVMHEGIRWALDRPSMPQEQKVHVYYDSATAE